MTQRCLQPRTAILDRPGGVRQRELLLGQAFVSHSEQNGYVQGHATHDGYAGYVATDALDPTAPNPTHYVSVIRTYAKEVPDLKDTGPALDLSFGSLVHVQGQTGSWARISIGGNLFYIPSIHLRPIGDTFPDPVALAEAFLGTPYLWGGNSAFGIDCSGLVQVALLACGIPCPGDSGPQAETLGRDVKSRQDLQRGDLVFWQGHVAICVDDSTLIHANASDMAVAYEGIDATITRIKTAGDGSVTAMKRLP